MQPQQRDEEVIEGWQDLESRKFQTAEISLGRDTYIPIMLLWNEPSNYALKVI